MKYFVSTILIILSFSCNTINNDAVSTYFGGEIINPRSDFVLFLKDDIIIDTLQLDKKNRFLNEFKSLDEGYIPLNMVLSFNMYTYNQKIVF